MSNKMKKEEINEIVSDRSNQSNDKIINSMNFLSEKHEEVKNLIIKLSYELDDIELNYGKLLEEYKKRSKK